MITEDSRIFDAHISQLEAVREFLAPFRAALPPKRGMHLDLAVEEIIVNICSYAYMTPPGEFTVRAKIDDGSLFVEMEDSGIPFDPMEHDDPDTSAPLDDRAIGGLGILLVRRLMDEVHYSRDGSNNILSIGIRLTGDD